MNSLDYALFILIGLFALLGYRKGLVRQAVELLGFFFSLIAAYLAAPTLATYLNVWFNISGYLEIHVPTGVPVLQIIQVILNILSFILIYYLCKILVAMLSQMIKSTTTVPVLSFLNQFSGLLLGLVKGIAIVAFFLIIMGLVPDKFLPNICKNSLFLRNSTIWLGCLKQLGIIFIEKLKDYVPAIANKAFP